MEEYNFIQSTLKLSILDLRVWVHLGCTDQEKFHPQLVSLTINLTFQRPPKAVVTDKLEDTLCYSELVENIKSWCCDKHFNLIEHLAATVHNAIRAFLDSREFFISSITVTAHKMAVPVQDVHGGVTCTYCDTREV